MDDYEKQIREATGSYVADYENSGRTSLPSDLRLKQLKRLIYHSRRIKNLAGLSLVAFIATCGQTVIIPLLAPSLAEGVGVFVAGIIACVFYGFTTRGLFARPRWGRPLGIFSSVVMFFFIPTGLVAPFENYYIRPESILGYLEILVLIPVMVVCIICIGGFIGLFAGKSLFGKGAYTHEALIRERDSRS